MKKAIRTNNNVIALSGISNTGKTLCLQYLIDKLKMNKILYCYERNMNYFDVLLKNGVPVLNLYNGYKDFIIAFEIDNKKVGVITYGDNIISLDDSFYELEQLNCDVIICACHPHGKTIEFLKEITKDGNLIIHNRWGIESTLNQDKYRQRSIDYQVNEIIEEIGDF